MEALKQLIVGTIAVTVMGVAYDAAAEAGVIKGDGQDHTVPYFASPVMNSQSAASSTTIVFNATTGDE